MDGEMGLTPEELARLPFLPAPLVSCGGCQLRRFAARSLRSAVRKLYSSGAGTLARAVQAESCDVVNSPGLLSGRVNEPALTFAERCFNLRFSAVDDGAEDGPASYPHHTRDLELP
jgi:hypothetical protein